MSATAGPPEGQRAAPPWDVIEISGVPGLPGGVLALLVRLAPAGDAAGPLGELSFHPSVAAAERAAGAAPRRPEVAPLPEVRRQLAEYFAGRRQTFRLPLAPRGTAFERRVWQELCAIPPGETRSYAEVARAIGHPDACRAVGRANGRNPIAVVIPCHRVIGSDGSLTGYGGGLPLKRFLLDLEGARSAGRGRPADAPQLALPL